MYQDAYTITKGHIYFPAEHFLQCYCHLVSFSNKYKIRLVNKLDFRFKLTAVPSEAIFRYLISGAMNILCLFEEKLLLSNEELFVFLPWNNSV